MELFFVFFFQTSKMSLCLIYYFLRNHKTNCNLCFYFWVTSVIRMCWMMGEAENSCIVIWERDRALKSCPWLYEQRALNYSILYLIVLSANKTLIHLNIHENPVTESEWPWLLSQSAYAPQPPSQWKSKGTKSCRSGAGTPSSVTDLWAKVTLGELDKHSGWNIKLLTALWLKVIIQFILKRSSQYTCHQSSSLPKTKGCI